MRKVMSIDDWLQEPSDQKWRETKNEPCFNQDESNNEIFFYEGENEDLMYRALLSQCSDSERRLIEEVAGGDYWLAQSFLHDLNKD